MNHSVVFLNLAGEVVRWNEAARRMFGYVAAEVLGRHLSLFYSDEERAKQTPERELGLASNLGWWECNGWLIRRDGAAFRCSGVMLTIPAQFGGDAAFVRVFADQTLALENERSLHEARDQMRQALSAAKMGTWRWDFRRDLQVRDENLNLMLGLSSVHPAVSVGDFLDFVHPEDRKRAADALIASSRGRNLDTEVRFVRADGAVRWMHIQGDVFGTWGSEPTFMAGVCADVTDRKSLELEIEMAKGVLEGRIQQRTVDLEHAVSALKREANRRRAAQGARKRLLGRIVDSQEEERRRISRELHDSVGQYITAITLGLKSMADHLPQEGPARAAADRLLSLAGELGQEVQRMAHDLRPQALDDVGLVDALQQHLESWAALVKIPIEFHAQGFDGFKPTMEVASTVFRVVQEALTNVARHSQASRVSVVLECVQGRLSAIVEDDGRGFEADKRMGVKGGTRRLGLLGMRERASLVGGELEIESRPGGGTTVYLRVPLPNDPAAETA